MRFMNWVTIVFFVSACLNTALVFSQQLQQLKVIPSNTENQVDVYIDDKLFTSFLYPATLEKPVLFPINASNGRMITRGFPLKPQPNEPTDHPHHVGLWFNFENVNGLDFWNNSYAIPPEKKHLYGWIITDKILQTESGKKGILSYHANWINQQKKVILEETTRYEFSGYKNQRIIDRVTTLKADTSTVFTDSKDGLLGLRLAHELQIPTNEDQSFTDNKGNITLVKGGSDKIANGTYLTSEGKTGNNAWSTRAAWCKAYGKMGADSVSVTIFDFPENPNYPTFWHARGYGLFAANPLGEKIFTNGKSEKNLKLNMGEQLVFRYRIVITNGNYTPSTIQLNKISEMFKP